MKTLFRSVVLVGVCGAVLGCGSDQATVSQAAGETCAADQILWTFGPTGQSGASAATQASADASVPVIRRNTIVSVEAIDCIFRPRGPDGLLIREPDGGVRQEVRAQNLTYWTRNCRDLSRCTLPSTCIPPRTDPDYRRLEASFSQVYASVRCSDGQSRAEFVPGYSSRASLTIGCPQPVVPLAAQQQRTACVPRVCSGSMRRDENMNCVQDSTRPLVRENNLSLLPMSLTPQLAPFRAPTRERTVRRIQKDNLYRFQSGVQYLNITPPANARLALWMSEVHDDAFDAGVRNASSRSASESFRCLVKVFDVGVRSADGGVVAAGRHTAVIDDLIELPRDCFSEGVAFENQYPLMPLSLRLSLPRQRVSQLKFHVSYDLENTTNFIPTGKTQVEACGADPLPFFYSAESGLYDYRSYYRQRELTPYDADWVEPVPNQGSYRWSSYEGFFDGRTGDHVQFGLTDTRVARPEVTIRVNSAATQSISVNADWYVALDSEEYFRSLIGPNLRPKFRVYLVPRADGGIAEPEGAEGYPTIGAVDVPGLGIDGMGPVGPKGVTVNSRFIVDPPLKQKLLTPGSLAYVDDGQKTFEVLGCLELRGGDYWVTPEYWKQDRDYQFMNGVYEGNEADSDVAFRPPGAPSPGNGCRWSKTPLVVTIDKSIGVVEPIADELWQGQASNQSSGNGSVNQSNDNDVDRTCQAMDGGLERCEQGSGAGQVGKGDYGKSYYATSTSSVYTPGGLTMTGGMPQDGSDSAGGAEVLGFQVLDPEAEEPDKQWEFNPVSKTRKVTLTITPPWDELWMRLKMSTEGNLNPEWVRGSYAGLMGLGVGWGYKQPVGSFGTVTFTVTVGFGLALVVGVSHSTEPDGAYQCIRPALPDGGVPAGCLQLGDQPRSFVDANNDCATRGARLAELSTLDEAAALETLLTGPNKPNEPVWIGAQQRDEFDPAFCLFGWNEALCRPRHKTSFRWLSNDHTFARTTGDSAGTIDPSEISVSGAGPNLLPKAPAKAGVVLTPNGTVASAAVSEAHPYVCAYDAARSDTPIVVSAAIDLSFAVGVGIEWCWPAEGKFDTADKFGLGICLAGTLNLVALKLSPTVETTFHHLKDHRGRSARRDNVNLFAEWGLTLLEGEVVFKVKALWFEFSMVLLEFGGFKIDGGKLYDFNFPTWERFQ